MSEQCGVRFGMGPRCVHEKNHDGPHKGRVVHYVDKQPVESFMEFTDEQVARSEKHITRNLSRFD